MNPRPPLTVRRLIRWVAVAAVALAIVRYPYRFIRQQQLFRAREREGEALLNAYRAQCPPGVSPAAWSQAVDLVHTAWGNVVFSPEDIDDAALDALLADLRGLVARAAPAEAEGDLYDILDLLARARTRASPRYLSGMRVMLRSTLPGGGRPSPGLVLYALSRLGSSGGEPALDSIIGGLKAGDQSVRVACCRAMGQYGLGLGSTAEAETAIDGLFHVLDDDDPLVRQVAAECLDEIGQGAVRATYGRIAKVLLRDPDARVRRQAVDAMENIRPLDDGAIATLTELATRDAEPSVKAAARDTLERIDPARWQGPRRE